MSDMQASDSEQGKEQEHVIIEPTNSSDNEAGFILEIVGRGAMAVNNVPGRLAVTRIRGREECIVYIERRYRWLANMMGGSAKLCNLALDIVFSESAKDD